MSLMRLARATAAPLKGGNKDAGSHVKSPHKADGPSPRKPKEDAGKKVAEAVNAVAQFVPAEIIGVYVTFAGFFSPLSTNAGWILMGGCTLLLPLLILLGAKIPIAGEAVDLSGKKAAALIIGSLIAFIAWVWALPNSPFVGLWGEQQPKIGAALVVVLSIVLPLAARKMKIIRSGA